MEFKHLYQPIQIAGLTLPNRFYMGSMHLALENEPDGFQRMVDFYRERAKGEAGLIITGGAGVSPEGSFGEEGLGVWDDSQVEKLAKIADAVHEEGGRVALQLFHGGRYARTDQTKLQPVAPSPLQARINPYKPRELSTQEVWELVDAFAQGARRAKEAGFDGVEIMGSEGYLINQFLSPLTNKRTDMWGGPFENRARFSIEILKAIRRVVGPDFPVIFRMSAMDLMEGSTTEEETLRYAELLAANGADAINTGIGWHESMVPTIYMGVPRAAFKEIAKKIKSRIDKPVVISNRINKLEIAEQLLADGCADMVSMARPFLADPYLVVKGKTGRLDEINTCIGCNQACLDNIFDGRAATCLVNPAAGRERAFAILPALKRKTVAVVGAGPAGMEAARVLAERGHQVHLFEKGDRIGGQLNLAVRIPGKKEFGETIRYYQAQFKKLGVNLMLHCEAGVNEILKVNPDAVVISSGVRPRLPKIPGIDLPHVASYVDVLQGKVSVGEKVAIIGGGGIAVDVAHFLTTPASLHDDPEAFLRYYQVSDLQKGKGLQPAQHYIQKRVPQVTMMRRGKIIGEGLGKTTRWITMQLLRNHQVKFLTEVAYREINCEAVVVEKAGQEVRVEADTVIIAAGQVSEDELYEQLQAMSRIPVYKIGGAKGAAELDAMRAILEGNQVGRAI